MAQIQRSRIAGTGMYVPPRVVTNHELAAMMTTSDEWIRQRSGIVERRHVDPGVGPTDLAEKACRSAVESSGSKMQDIDLILVATLSPEHFFPSTAVFLQRRLGLDTVPAMDIRGQCSGFLYALNVANAFVASGQYRKVLVCGTEVHSRGVEFNDRGRDVAVLFGDGAAAVIVEPCLDPERGIITSRMYSEGQYAEKLWVEYPSMARQPHLSPEIVAEGGVYPKMDGKFVFKNAVTRLPQVINEVLSSTHLKVRDIDLFLFHQANLRINEMVAQHMGITGEQVFNNIDKYGNCSAASIPICLDEAVRQKRIKRGDLVCMAAFGSGFTWSATLMRW